VSDDTQIRIDLDATTPVNRQIVEQIRTLLVEGALPPGADLPSVRRLATDLGVHFATVADAYRTLAEEGWLEISHGRSARVLPRRAPAADREADDLFRRRLRQLVAEARSQGVSATNVSNGSCMTPSISRKITEGHLKWRRRPRSRSRHTLR